MSQKINLRKLAWWNRQPTLWSHSCPVMEIVPRDDEEDVIGVPPLSIEPLNMDFDGAYVFPSKIKMTNSNKN